MPRVYSTSPLILGIIEDIPADLIRPFEYNYRYDTGDLDDLCRSIREKGLLQPILVRNKEEAYYEIIAGHRRYQACKKICWRKIICHIVELEDKDAFEVSLIENVQRKTLNPIEEAHAYKKYVLNFGWGGISDLASRIGKSISYIDKRVRLLGLPSEVVDAISKSSVLPSTAEELLSIRNKNKQSELANLAHANGLSSRDVRELIKNVKRNTVYDYDGNKGAFEVKIRNLDEKTQRSFDKSIIALRIAMNKLSSIIGELEENWIIYEILMQHKNMLHHQIDVLIKEKMKL
jgi:ParB family transcriptional regulator, chromosome partitioning protein